MTRVRFFPGQMISAEDFEAEQNYHREKRRLLNRLLLGAGVVEGLGVSVSGSDVEVSKGTAIDRLGNEVVAEVPIGLDLAEWAGDSAFVTIQFMETPTDPVPVFDGGVEFTRVTEGSVIQLTAEDPCDDPESMLVCVVRLCRVGGAWQVDLEPHSR